MPAVRLVRPPDDDDVAVGLDVPICHEPAHQPGPWGLWDRFAIERSPASGRARPWASRLLAPVRALRTVATRTVRRGPLGGASRTTGRSPLRSTAAARGVGRAGFRTCAGCAGAVRGARVVTRRRPATGHQADPRNGVQTCDRSSHFARTNAPDHTTGSAQPALRSRW